MRPPRSDATTAAAKRSAHGSKTAGVSGGAGSRVTSIPSGPILVVDDLLAWSGEGDEGPAGDGFGATEGNMDGTGQGRTAWDGTALAHEYLRAEGSALVNRYFQADGEIQRGR